MKGREVPLELSSVRPVGGRYNAFDDARVLTRRRRANARVRRFSGGGRVQQATLPMQRGHENCAPGWYTAGSGGNGGSGGKIPIVTFDVLCMRNFIPHFSPFTRKIY